MQTAIQAAIHRPFLFEARDYCEYRSGGDYRNEPSPEEVENVRMSMCHREFMRRTQWIRDVLVKNHPSLIGLETSDEWVKLEALAKEMLKREANDLGLSYGI